MEHEVGYELGLPKNDSCSEILQQLRLVVYPIIYRCFFTSQVVSRISEPSTVPK